MDHRLRPTRPSSRIHAGVDARFIPKLTADAVDMKVIDQIVHIPGAEGIKWSGELARKESSSSA